MPWFSSWTCDLNTALLQREECPAALAGWEQGGLGNKWGKFNAGIHSGDAQVWCSGEEVLSLQSSKLFSLQIKWEGVFLVRCLRVWFGFNVDFYIKKKINFIRTERPDVCAASSVEPRASSCCCQTVAGSHTPLDVSQNSPGTGVCPALGKGLYLIKLQHIF